MHTPHATPHEDSSGVVIRQMPYWVPEACRQAIEVKVAQMLKDGIIKESTSPWSSRIVMVPKPGSSLHLCNDFRKLSEYFELDSYPMPQVDELVERLGRVWFILTLDLTKGYWQVLLAPSAIDDI